MEASWFLKGTIFASLGSESPAIGYNLTVEKPKSLDDGVLPGTSTLSSLGRAKPNNKSLFKKAKGIDKKKVLINPKIQVPTQTRSITMEPHQTF